ncbi:hypothetical protein FRB95_001397 [Tulasnella sp. JGI-2019a]|nr:hypothetical protein FRB95_001397 [Tulasnella sp. JGI-2019a]
MDSNLLSFTEPRVDDHTYTQTGALNPGPLDLFPNELLASILSLSTHTADLEELARQLDYDTVFPFTALRVCKRWREVTYGTSGIWAVAAIKARPEWYPRLIEHAQRCGDRSMELSVSMDVTRHAKFFECFEAFNGHTKPASELQLLHKIRRLRIICPRGKFITSSSNVEELMFVLKRWGARLEEVEWVISESDGSMDTSIVWCLITEWLIEICKFHSGLRSLRLGGIRVFTQQDTSSSNKISWLLPELEVLVLDDCDAHTIEFLRYAEMPTLHTLSISCSDTPDHDPKAQSRAMSTRIAHIPSVQQLTLVRIPTLQDLMKVLSSVPNVKHLTLDGRWTTEPFDNEVQGFVIHLESLKVLGLSTKIGMTRVKCVVETRLGTLQSVTLEVRGGEVEDSKEAEELKWFQEHGVVFSSLFPTDYSTGVKGLEHDTQST